MCMEQEESLCQHAPRGRICTNFCFQMPKNHITRNMNMCQEVHLKIFEKIHLYIRVLINSNLKDNLISNLLNLECLVVAFLFVCLID